MTSAADFIRATRGADVPEHLQRIANELGYHIEYRPLVHRRGWPQRSAKPWALSMKSGDKWHHLASFATLKLLERNFRGRAGC